MTDDWKRRIIPVITVEIAVPRGYRSAQEFLDDCGFERAERVPIASTPEMRGRLRELASPSRDDFDRAVLIVLDDFDRLEARTK
jgi:hypothetical protein